MWDRYLGLALASPTPHPSAVVRWLPTTAASGELGAVLLVAHDAALQAGLAWVAFECPTTVHAIGGSTGESLVVVASRAWTPPDWTRGHTARGTSAIVRAWPVDWDDLWRWCESVATPL